MYQIVAVDTRKTVELIENYDEADSICITLEHMGKHCSELVFTEADVNVDNYAYMTLAEIEEDWKSRKN